MKSRLVSPPAYVSRSATPVSRFASQLNPEAVRRLAGNGSYSGCSCSRSVAGVGVHRQVAVSSPHDSHEREAESTADRIMRMSDSGAAGHISAPAGGDVASKEQVLQTAGIAEGALPDPGPGRPLDPGVREFMEPKFGADFGDVRVHTGPQAAQSALAVNSLAYTRGKSIVFGPGQYAPETKAGKRLLAHELAHVVQGGVGVSRLPLLPAILGGTAAAVAGVGIGFLGAYHLSGLINGKRGAETVGEKKKSTTECVEHWQKHGTYPKGCE